MRRSIGNLGVALTFQDKLPAAKEMLLEAVNRAPGDANLYCRLGFVYLRLGQQALALHCLGRSLELDPQRADAHKLMADTLRELKQPDRAIAHFERALEINPEMVPAMVNLAVALDERGDIGEALSSSTTRPSPPTPVLPASIPTAATRSPRPAVSRMRAHPSARRKQADPNEHEAFRQLALAKQYVPGDADSGAHAGDLFR